MGGICSSRPNGLTLALAGSNAASDLMAQSISAEVILVAEP